MDGKIKELSSSIKPIDPLSEWKRDDWNRFYNLIRSAFNGVGERKDYQTLLEFIWQNAKNENLNGSKQDLKKVFDKILYTELFFHHYPEGLISNPIYRSFEEMFEKWIPEFDSDDNHHEFRSFVEEFDFTPPEYLLEKLRRQFCFSDGDEFYTTLSAFVSFLEDRREKIGDENAVNIMQDGKLLARVRKDTLGVELRYIKSMGNIEGLSLLPNLEGLYVYHGKIKKIEGLDDLPGLKRLALPCNDICEIEGLESLENLEELNLISNRINEIKGLEHLEKLTYLDLSYNNIQDIKGLGSLASLETLFLAHNNISEIKGLESLKSLKRIELDDNPIHRDDEFFKTLSPRDQTTGKYFVEYCKKKILGTP